MGDFVEFAQAHAAYWHSTATKLKLSRSSALKGKGRQIDLDDEQIFPRDVIEDKKWSGMQKAKIDA